MRLATGSATRIARGAALLRRAVVVVVVLALAACARPMTFTAKVLPEHAANASPKKAVYIYAEADRQREVITGGGGGDKVSYHPYRDFERAFRAALSSQYAEVSSLGSASDLAAIKATGASFVFVPTIATTSSSPSLVTWPPTKFNLTVSVEVLRPDGLPITRFKASGDGTAEFDEFKSELGLSARRAAEQAAQAVADEIRKSPLLK